MTELETLFAVRAILLRGHRTVEVDLALGLITACIRRRPQTDLDPTEPSTACPDERPAPT